MKALNFSIFFTLSILLVGCIVPEQKSSDAPNISADSVRTFPRILNSIPKTKVNISEFVKKFPKATHISISGGYNNIIALEKEDFKSTSNVSISTPPKGQSIIIKAMSGNKILGSKAL